jgi:hypothetical protein
LKLPARTISTSPPGPASQFPVPRNQPQATGSRVTNTRAKPHSHTGKKPLPPATQNIPGSWNEHWHT